MKQVPDYPSKLFFFCEEAPEAGGETPVLLSHIIYDKMKEKHPLFVAKLEEHGLTYTRVMTDDNQQSSFNGSGWTSAYMTNDKNVAEERFLCTSEFCYIESNKVHACYYVKRIYII